MKGWVRDEWGNIFTNPPTEGSTGKILVAGIHKAQQTDAVKSSLKSKRTHLQSIPGGCTSKIHVIDVSIVKPFKLSIKEQFEEHLNANLHRYADGHILVSERRVLTTKWSKLCANPGTIKRAFKKCYI